MSSKPDASILEPNENISRNDFQENIKPGIQRTKSHNNKVLSNEPKTDCTTNAQTPKPLYAIHNPTNPVSNVTASDILARVLKSMEIESFALGMPEKELITRLSATTLVTSSNKGMS